MNADQEARLETLTRRAMKACEAGCWDEVAALYHRRAQEFPIGKISPGAIKRLIAWDRAIRARARLAQAATHQNLVEIQQQRRRLGQLKQQWLHSVKPGSRLAQSV